MKKGVTMKKLNFVLLAIMLVSLIFAFTACDLIHGQNNGNGNAQNNGNDNDVAKSKGIIEKTNTALENFGKPAASSSQTLLSVISKSEGLLFNNADETISTAPDIMEYILKNGEDMDPYYFEMSYQGYIAAYYAISQTALQIIEAAGEDSFMYKFEDLNVTMSGDNQTLGMYKGVVNDFMINGVDDDGNLSITIETTYREFYKDTPLSIPDGQDGTVKLILSVFDKSENDFGFSYYIYSELEGTIMQMSYLTFNLGTLYNYSVEYMSSKYNAYSFKDATIKVENKNTAQSYDTVIDSLGNAIINDSEAILSASVGGENRDVYNKDITIEFDADYYSELSVLPVK